MTSQTSTSQPAQAGNELWFTRGTKRFQRIGETMRVVTEGATVDFTLGSDGITRVKIVVTAPNVVVNKSVRKSAQATEAVTDASLAALRAQLTGPQATEPAPAKPAPAKPAARKPAKPKAGAAK